MYIYIYETMSIKECQASYMQFLLLTCGIILFISLKLLFFSLISPSINESPISSVVCGGKKATE